MEKTNKKWPFHGWLGLILIAVFWILNWSLPGNRTHVLFFPLWLGYGLTVDALVKVRKGTSLLTRSPVAYIGLFFVSAPAWWLFELLNRRSQNWIYLGIDNFTGFEYFLFATLNFSTVIPAVFGTAELVGTIPFIRKIKKGLKILSYPKNPAFFFITGWVMLCLLLLRPRYFFPFMWLSVFFILDPINARLGNRSLLAEAEKGEWRTLLSLSLGCLICGFFWEMWNFLSFPKWIYRVPFVGFRHVFEMPVLGYLGYIPFSWELFALYHLVAGFFSKKTEAAYIQITSMN
ncbi:MAG: hypothetical protein JXB26_07410 [Candidatus Aminicenantes bacterium]|nr:hypothetical protein [Candidatus Aminicenantes bacterium]